MDGLSIYYSQSNLVIPELDSDPAILKIIHDGEKLERETRRKELMQLLKIPPPPPPTTTTTTSEFDESMSPSTSRAMNYSFDHGNLPMTPRSVTDVDWTSQIWIKRTVPVTPNSTSYRRPHYRSALHQHSLNSSGENRMNNLNFSAKKNRSEMNISSPTSTHSNPSPGRSMNKTNGNISMTPSGVIVTDYRQAMMMTRIVNPQWNIIPFA